MEYDPSSKVITSSPPYSGPFVEVDPSMPKLAGTFVLSIWIIFSNLVIILALLTSDKRRKISYNIHVINLAIISLIMGCVVLTLYIDYELQAEWVHGDNICRFWLISDLLVCTVSVLIIGIMVFDRFVMFSCTSLAEGSGKFVFSAFVFLLPWILGCGFVIPVYLFGETGSGIGHNNCGIGLSNTFSILMILGGYFVPGVAAFGILVAMTLTLFVRKDKLNEMDWVEEIEDKGWQVLMSWIQHIAVLSMWLPYNALFLILAITGDTWANYLEASMWLGYANAGLTPLIWMLMPRVRKSMARLFCCCCRSKAPRRQLNFRTDYTLEDDANVSMLEYRIKKSNV